MGVPDVTLLANPDGSLALQGGSLVVSPTQAAFDDCCCGCAKCKCTSDLTLSLSIPSASSFQFNYPFGGAPTHTVNSIVIPPVTLTKGTGTTWTGTSGDGTATISPAMESDGATEATAIAIVTLSCAGTGSTTWTLNVLIEVMFPDPYAMIFPSPCPQGPVQWVLIASASVTIDDPCSDDEIDIGASLNLTTLGGWGITPPSTESLPHQSRPRPGKHRHPDASRHERHGVRRLAG